MCAFSSDYFVSLVTAKIVIMKCFPGKDSYFPYDSCSIEYSRLMFTLLNYSGFH